MALDTTSLIDLAVTSAEVEHGRRLERTPGAIAAFGRVTVKVRSSKARVWTPGEEAFLRAALGKISEEDIALQLGRTKTAVHLHWKREMGLMAPSKAPDVITAQRIALALGVDGHKTAHWCDVGLIPGRLLPGDRKIRLIDRVLFMQWACSPANWVYFNPRKVADPHLRRLLNLRAKRWSDEWWTTRQVANHHGVDIKDVTRYILLGKIAACLPAVSRGGRHPNGKWGFWFILRSEATRPGFHFVRRGEDRSALTPRGKAWMKKALKMGMNCADIGRTMKVKNATVCNWVKRNFPRSMPLSGGAGHSKRRRR